MKKKDDTKLVLLYIPSTSSIDFQHQALAHTKKNATLHTSDCSRFFNWLNLLSSLFTDNMWSSQSTTLLFSLWHVMFTQSAKYPHIKNSKTNLNPLRKKLINIQRFKNVKGKKWQQTIVKCNYECWPADPKLWIRHLDNLAIMLQIQH